MHRSSPFSLWLQALWGLLTWAAAWGLMVALDPHIALANLAMLWVLAAAVAVAVAGDGLSVPTSMGLSLLSLLAFNWRFVPPRGSFLIDTHQHALLLLAMGGLSWMLAALMGRLRWQVAEAARHAHQAEQLRELSEHLRDAEQPQNLAPHLIEALQSLADGPVRLLLQEGLASAAASREQLTLLGGSVDADQRTGLWLCMREQHPFGPGTGRYEELPAWYLPLRGRASSHGAALLPLAVPSLATAALRAHAQALCNQMGLALERLATERAAAQARNEALNQSLRNALLAAISHDYRTPLASIMTAASALQDQDARLSPAQRARLADTVLDETQQLLRMTENSLQLARLDTPHVQLRKDWESPEEIVGALLRRARRHRLHGEQGLRARLEPGLPLLLCDAVLLAQLLDNLVDNALKYGGSSGVELWVRMATHEGQPQMVWAVRDRGPGVKLADRARIFEPFQRGLDPQRPDANTRRGAGVGLAACRAIAQAHGGEMRLRQRSHGGSSFECWLPVAKAPSDNSSEAPAP